MSNNPLRVSLDNIIPLTEARDHFSQIVNEVQKDKLYVLTKGGKPAVAIVDVKYLEYISGGHVNTSHVEAEIQKNPAKVGRPEMIKHEAPSPASTSIPAAAVEPKKIVIPPPPATPPVFNQPASQPQNQDKDNSFFDSVSKNTHANPDPFSVPSPTQAPSSPPPPAPVSDQASGNTINVQMMSDPDDGDEKNDAPSTRTALGSLTSPDDMANPAQYTGEQNEHDEDDMPID